MEYTIMRTVTTPRLEADWDSEDWRLANSAELRHFHPKSPSRHPRVQVKLLHDSSGIYGLFRVDDQYVRSVITNYLGSVCGDSCVEFFVQPGGRGGYLNIEINCGGTLLVYYITDPTRTSTGFKEYIPLPPSDGGRIAIFHSMPSTVEPEITEPVIWRNAFFLPADLLARYGDVHPPYTGQIWRGNFYKCADRTSHPHWLSWTPLDQCNFHQPDCFGRLVFA